MSVVAAVCAVLSFSGEKGPKAYPFSGQVVSIGTEMSTGSIPPYTDPYGKVHGGLVTTRRRYVYTIRTDKLEYDVAGRRRLDSALAVGHVVSFRVSKGSFCVLTGEKEKRFAIVGERQRTLPNR